MRDLGDRSEDSTIDFCFHTTNLSAVPTTLAGTPAISVYKANGTTQSTAGVTLTVDFDSVTGLNQVRIDTSADAFYATGNDYSIVITTGTVNSISVVGAVVATFSIENRAAVSDIASLTTTVGTAGAGLTDLGGMSTSMKAEVNAEALDVLVTDTHAEPSSVPAATASLKDKIGFLAAMLRNKSTQTNTTKTLRNDADSGDIGTSSISDDGTTFTRNEWT